MLQKISKIEIITRPRMLSNLKKALDEIGVTGITVSNVLGCGMQNSPAEYYLDVPLNLHLHPKIKVEIVICDIPVERVVETAKKALYTGEVGDGKIFVYDVANVIRVRTGEEGQSAI